MTLRAGAVFDQLGKIGSVQLPPPLLRSAPDRALAVAEADGRALLVNGCGQAAFELNHASLRHGDNPFSGALLVSGMR